MTEVYITRHGETDWNVQEIFRGRADVDLNTSGLEQAELLAKHLKDVRFEAIFTSPLERALRTAQIVARTHYRVNVEASMDLIDFDYGEWQGVPLADVKEKYKEIYDRWLKEPHRVKIPGGESLNDVKKRTQRFINSIVVNHKGPVLLVTHRVVAKVLIMQMLGLDNSHFWNIKLDTCGVTIFGYEEGNFTLTRHNDNCFLESIRKGTLEDF